MMGLYEEQLSSTVSFKVGRALHMIAPSSVYLRRDSVRLMKTACLVQDHPANFTGWVFETSTPRSQPQLSNYDRFSFPASLGSF